MQGVKGPPHLLTQSVDIGTARNVTNVSLLAGKMDEIASGVTPVNPKFRSGLLAMSCALGWADGPSRDDFYINHALKVC